MSRSSTAVSESVDMRAAGRFREALALHRESRLVEAAAAYRQVLEWQPRHAHALTFLSVIALENNDCESALELTRRAIEADPRGAGIHLLRGHAFARLGRLEAALASYDLALALKPSAADIHNERGNVLRRMGRHDSAVTSYATVIALAPHLPAPYYNHGLALHDLKQYDAALAGFDQAIAINPRYADALYARANLLKDMRQLHAAVASYDRAIAAKPDHAAAYVNRGNVETELERFDAALASYDASIAIAPDSAEAHSNRGSLLGTLGRHHEALASFDRALAIDPAHAQAHYNRAFVHLALGDLEHGWRDFEWRWKNEHCASPREARNFIRPRWLGEEPLDGKTLLVHCEQGFGDSIQFCRYLPRVAALGAKVVLEVPESLHGLFTHLDGVARLVVYGQPLPPFDCFCPLLSLPLALKTTLATIPARVPYLRVGEDPVRRWRDKLGVRSRRRVGLVWSSGVRPDQPECWSVNQRRNIPLTKLAPLEHPALEFYSLQKGQPAEGELAALIAGHWQGPKLLNHTHELHDFEETAALIEQLDLVISVDTATAHLAGALGKRVWLLLRFDSCWRWLLERSDSPWYPTMRLYRQTTRGDWEGVVRKLRVDLEQFAESADEDG